jgi:hypothetical protein
MYMVGLHACVNLTIFRLNQERKLDIDWDVDFLASDFSKVSRWYTTWPIIMAGIASTSQLVHIIYICPW